MRNMEKMYLDRLVYIENNVNDLWETWEHDITSLIEDALDDENIKPDEFQRIIDIAYDTKERIKSRIYGGK